MAEIGPVRTVFLFNKTILFVVLVFNMALNRFHYTQLKSGHQVKVFWFSCKTIPDCIGNHFLYFFLRTFDIDDEMHFTDVEMAEEDMFSVENETDVNEDESSSIIETFLQTAYPSDSEW